jgi:hypothetical protein
MVGSHEERRGGEERKKFLNSETENKNWCVASEKSP